MARVSWKMKKLADGSYEGWVILPVGIADIRRAAAMPRGVAPRPVVRAHPRPLALKAKGKTPASALESAASVASKIIGNPIVSSMLPPGSGVAVKGINMLASAAKKGKLGKAIGKIVGPGAKRLGKALLSFF